MITVAPSPNLHLELHIAHTGSTFKGFQTLEEAQSFMQSGSSGIQQQTDANLTSLCIPAFSNDSTVHKHQKPILEGATAARALHINAQGNVPECVVDSDVPGDDGDVDAAPVASTQHDLQHSLDAALLYKLVPNVCSHAFCWGCYQLDAPTHASCPLPRLPTPHPTDTSLLYTPTPTHTNTHRILMVRHGATQVLLVLVLCCMRQIVGVRWQWCAGVFPVPQTTKPRLLRWCWG